MQSLADNIIFSVGVASPNSLAAGEHYQLNVCRLSGHGTGIFAAVVGLDKLLLEFFRQNL